MAVDPDVRSALAEIGERRSAAELMRAQAMSDLAVWVPVAMAAGVTVVEIARLSGVTRPTVYAIIGRAPTSAT